MIALIRDAECKSALLSAGAQFVFSIYDSDGTGGIDAADLGGVLRALNLNPTLATIEKLGGTKKKGEFCASVLTTTEELT